MTDQPLKYRRVLLKLSGEALMGAEDYGIDPTVLKALAAEIVQVQQAGVQIGLCSAAATSSAVPAWPLPAWTASPATTWACWRR